MPAYQPNIPAATDQLSKSQGDIQGNFQALMTLIDVNHVDFAGTAPGKHFVVSMPNQLTSPPSIQGFSFLAGEVGMYNFINPAVSGGTGANEVYLHTSKSGGAVIQEVPLTASNQNVSGWCYLPSGLLLKWTTVSFAFSASVAINGPSLGPVYTNLLHVFITSFGTSITSNNVVGWNRSASTPTTVILLGSGGGVQAVNILTIGN